MRRADSGSGAGGHPVGLEQPADPFEQTVHADGLGQDLVMMDRVGGGLLQLAPIGRHDHDRHHGMQLAQLLRQGPPGHAGHRQVDQEQVGAVAGGDLEAGGAVGGGQDGEIQRGQQVDQQLAVGRIVVGHHHAAPGRRV